MSACCAPSGMSVQLVSASSSCSEWGGAACFEVQNAGPSLRAELQHQSSRADFHTLTGEHLTVLTKHSISMKNYTSIYIKAASKTAQLVAQQPWRAIWIMLNTLWITRSAACLRRSRQLNIWFCMSNLESDHLAPGFDSWPTITSDFTEYLFCITHHGPIINRLGMMLTWHTLTQIFSQITACICIIWILLLDFVKTPYRKKLSKWEFKYIAMGFTRFGVLSTHKCVFLSLSFSTQRVYSLPLRSRTLRKLIKLAPQVDSSSATEWLIDGGLFLMLC